MLPSETIRQAERSDVSDIARFLSHAACVHRHLDWQGVLDWIPYSPFLLMKEEDHPLGLLTCPPGVDQIVWIRCFACERYPLLSHVWSCLFSRALYSPELSGTTLYSVGLNDWFAEILKDSNFENFQNIVILNWNHEMPIHQKQSLEYFIRPMEFSDIDQVAFLDQTAFEPIWVNPPDKIALAYEQAEHSSVAEINGKIIGYEMTTANHFSAHLARIAVHPDHQHKHIGSNLIVEMFNYFRRKGIEQISVNTQSDNDSSLALYQSLGFELSGESFPVFRYSI